MPTLEKQSVEYGYTDAKNDARVVKVKIDVPNFLGALDLASDQIEGNSITHVSKS